MDTFFEQIIPIKKTGSSVFAVLGIWFAAILISLLLLFVFPVFGSFTVIIVCGILWGAWKLSSKFNIEYEYIITNGTMDIDKIINKSSRKRMCTMELSGVSRLEKFNMGLVNNINKKELVIACNLDDPDAYYMVCDREGKGAVHLIFAPEERLKGAIIKFIPKFIANSAFK